MALRRLCAASSRRVAIRFRSGRLSLALLASLCVAALVLLGAPPGDGSRAFLWRVVQACLVDHTATGSAFPCLALDLRGGDERGYAVIRSPLERVHVVVTPTVRTIGIEAPRLRGADAPPYFHDAWEARRFVTETLATPPDRAGIGLAVNSRRGRSQDQLHIHVGCLRPPIRRTLAELLPSLRQTAWSPIKVLPRAPTYWAHIEPSRDLADVNVFDRIADGLSIPQSEMHDMTIVVVGLDAPSADAAAASPGFAILARKRIPHSEDEAHGEALLDDECSSIPLR